MVQLVELREHILEQVPLFQNMQEQVELGIVLVLVAEFVDKLDLAVEFDPVGPFVVPVPAEQMVAEDGAFLVRSLVGLQFKQGVYQVE